MALAHITRDALDLAALVEAVRSPKHGGYVTFSGDVRDNDDGKSVTGIDYHCYEPLATKELERIVREAQTRWTGTICAVAHRVGPVPAGESSVIIAVSAPHRADAFNACRWMIDTIKIQVPIWKREEFDGACPTWIEGDQRFDAQ